MATQTYVTDMQAIGQNTVQVHQVSLISIYRRSGLEFNFIGQWTGGSRPSI